MYVDNQNIKNLTVNLIKDTIIRDTYRDNIKSSKK